MRIDVDKQDFACIIDALELKLTKAQHKRAADLVRRLTAPPQPKTAHWAPMGRIRSGWPSVVGLGRVPKPHKTLTTKPYVPKPPPTADEILASI